MSAYSSMTLPALRNELRRRNAKLSGRKKELIERLEAYDRNQNFNQDVELLSEYNMVIPKADEYKDLHADMKLAPLTFDTAYEYLSEYNTEFDSAAVNLYQDKYLIYARLHSSEDLDYIKFSCHASHSRKMVYIIDISMTKSGHVHEAQCEFGAGEGPHGHCKHIRAALYACCKFVQTGVVNVELTCTEKLQSFHKAKKHLGSPLKACDLNMPGADEVCNITNFDPRPKEFRNTESYQHHFYNTCMNFKGISNVPIFQVFKPANARAVAMDHDYLKLTPEDQFLNSINVTNITDDEIKNIEFLTRGQNKNDRWREEREKRISSSNFGRICSAKEGTDLDKLAKSLINQRSFINEAMKHGLKNEKHAIYEYEQKFSVNVQKCGIYISKTLPFLGASPDGVVNDKLLCEIKCPFSAKNKPISPTTVPYLREIDGKLQLSTRHPYYFQIQGQLFCTEREYCDFVIYTVTDMKCIRIERDNDFISNMLDKLHSFFKKSFKSALLEKLFYKTI